MAVNPIETFLYAFFAVAGPLHSESGHGPKCQCFVKPSQSLTKEQSFPMRDGLPRVWRRERLVLGPKECEELRGLESDFTSKSTADVTTLGYFGCCHCPCEI